MELQDSSDDEQFLAQLRCSPSKDLDSEEDYKVKVSDFLLVAIRSEQKLKVKSVTRTLHFVGQMMEFLEPTNEYLVNFLKRGEEGKYYWPQNEDTPFIGEKDIIRVLPQPSIDNRERLTFSLSIDHFEMG